MAPLNLNAARTAALAQPGVDHGQYFADPNEKRGVRNNNPGNVEQVRSPERAGLHQAFGFLGTDSRFGVYATPIGGIAASYEILSDMQSRRGLNTLNDLIAAWAPAFENDVKAYVSAVSRATGIKPDQQLPSFFSRPDIASSIMSAMFSHEGATKGKYSAEMVRAGVELATDAQAKNFSKMDGISERGAMARNTQEQRDVFRGPSDYGAPVWDGTYNSEPTLAAPIGAVSYGGALPDLATAPGPDLGGNLSTDTPSSDFSPTVSDYGFSSMSFSPGMGQVQDQLSQTYAGTVPGGGAFVADTPSAPSAPATQDISPTGFSSRDMGSLGTWGGFGAGIAPEAMQTAPAAPAASPVSSYGFSNASVGSMAAPASLGSGITPNASPEISPTGFSKMDAISPGMTGAFGLSGIAGMAPTSPSTNTWGLDGITEAPAKPNTVAATQPELPGFTLPPEVVPPTTVAAPAPSVISTPTKNTAAPSRAPAPSLAAPTPVRSFSVKEATPAAAQPAQAAPSPMTPEAFLGSVMQGGPATIGGVDYGGLASRARADDQFSQPAMLGLERAYAQANGLQGPKGLFDGLFGGSWGINTPSVSMPDLSGIFSGQNIGRVGGGIVGGMVAGPLGAITGGLLGNYVGGMFGGNSQGGLNDGLGSVRDATTGAVLGGFDPSDPAHNGFAGWGDGWGGGLGNTPGAGGLY